MQSLIDAEQSDLFDVLAYVGYLRAPVARSERAKFAKVGINHVYLNNRQLDFVEFVLDHYVQQGVEELSMEKLSPLIRLKYHAIADASAQLGSADDIRALFIGFQRHLYERSDQANQE